MKLNKLPDELKCTMCNKHMIQDHIGAFHQYYKCVNSHCKDIVGLPLAQYQDYDSNTVFGSGAYKSERIE